MRSFAYSVCLVCCSFRSIFSLLFADGCLEFIDNDLGALAQCPISDAADGEGPTGANVVLRSQVIQKWLSKSVGMGLTSSSAISIG